jgi:predicted RNase H-like HicB family nuclease
MDRDSVYRAATCGQTGGSSPTARPPGPGSAYFPALPGCHTWGKTYEAAVKHAEEALIGFLEALRMNGEDIPVEHPSAPISLGLVVELPTVV